MTTRSISLSDSSSAGRSSERPRDSTRVRTISTSCSIESGSGRITVLKRRFSAEDRSCTPLSRSFAVAITLKPRRACTSSLSSGIGSVFSDRIVMSASCTSAGMRVSSSTRAIEPVGHGPHDRARHHRVAARSIGEQLGVVPAVADRLLAGARGALHQQRRVAADGRGQVLADPRLGGAGHAEQQQRPVGRERGDGDLDDPAGAEVLRRDLGAVGERAAEQVGGDGPRREPPLRRPGAVVGAFERRELVGVLVLRVGTQHVGRGGSAAVGAAVRSVMRRPR